MVYNYTKPRAPIAAMYSSPGPCYGLPGLVGQKTHDPRSAHNKGPAYPFGVRHGKFKDDCSPGPCYYPNPKVYRDGNDGTPQYSLYSRQRDPTMFKVPGPGAYSPEGVGQTAHFRHPQYSFGTRHRHRRTDNNPAPNNYTLTPMLGKTVTSGQKQAPIFSMKARSTIGSFHEDLAKAPGAGTYNTTEPSIYKDKSPLYSMTSRNVMPGDTTKKPGPGAHSPENVWMHKVKQPAPSFGIRHSQYLAPLIIAEAD
ncbi:ciliary microtubule associated protein 1A-like isoform X2 [Mytilus trossulus]|uniref:ciliary microtubule associated protein 1A-like isoform X2 n=1 Tax=Mytilus trossulus TaxID=6551 RepID=UPI00300674F0